MGYKERYEIWVNDSYFDESTRNELLALKGNDKEIQERFYKSLEFGTGGLRGIVGAGDNRMNKYTVGKASQGLANYILKNSEGVRKVAIAYDSRNFSPEFAQETALVMCANGIDAYVFESLRPTPMLSFAVRHLGCTAGVVITASHNPPEYNGYKVYWTDGAQVPYPRDEEIITEVNNVGEYKNIKTMKLDDAKAEGLYHVIDKSVDDEYVKNVKAQLVNQDMIKKHHDIGIVYTPIHGSGYVPVKRVLSEVGFSNVHIVKEQQEPDGNFSTVGYPNPEDPKVFELAIKLAEKVGAEVIVGTDPDADRVGAVVKNKDGEYVVLNGNMTGVLLAEYILSQKKLPENGALVSTIVSTNMTKVIAKNYGVDYFETLTGFKYIGEKILQFEQSGSHQYIFGFEESYGSLAGTYARDKDAVVATMLIAEVATYYKDRGMTLYDGLIEMYEKYGYYKEDINAITLKGLDGIELMGKILTNLRNNPPTVIDGKKVIEIRDYQAQVIKNVVTGEQTKITGMPKSDVLYYVLEDDSWFCVRPSGTEPKIKIYFGVSDVSNELAQDKLDRVMAGVNEVFENAKA